MSRTVKGLVATLYTTSVGLLLAAIWVPDRWWQLALTALLLFVAGAGISGNQNKREQW